jgi:hypothetical protein
MEGVLGGLIDCTFTLAIHAAACISKKLEKLLNIKRD